MINTFYQDKHITLYNGSCLDMSELPDESVQMVVTSPPYWGLRKYSGEQDLIWGGQKDCQHVWDIEKITAETWHRDGHVPDFGVEQPTRKTRPDMWQKVEHERGFCKLCGAWRGAYGLEPTPELYVQHTIEILREIRRVLRPDGVVFWNIGDSYAGSWGNNGSRDGGQRDKTQDRFERPAYEANTERPPTSFIKGKRIPRGNGRWGGGNNPASGVLKPKDLCLIPFRVAIAAQEDGWWVRSDIIWAKPNPMPESVTDRPTNSHEYILMLTKSAKYYWDADAVREPHSTPIHSPGNKVKPEMYAGPMDRGGNSQWERDMGETWGNPAGRNLRSVWTFPTQPYAEAHFAVFPEKLPELCIKAATPEVGCCSKCGKPWVRMVEKEPNGRTLGDPKMYKSNPVPGDDREYKGGAAGSVETKTIGWQPQCQCNADKVPSIVLDPFAGAGTTLWVAKKLNRKSVGFELSEEYCRLIVDRNRQQVMV